MPPCCVLKTPCHALIIITVVVWQISLQDFDGFLGEEFDYYLA